MTVVRVLFKAAVVVGAIAAATASVAMQPGAAAGAAATKCPAGVNAGTVRPAQVDDVIAAARRVVIDDKRENNQGRITRRTAANYPVIVAIELGEPQPLPGSVTLLRRAARSCGQTTARLSWAVIFTDVNSVLCCVRDVVFVVHLDNGWRVFR